MRLATQNMPAAALLPRLVYDAVPLASDAPTGAPANATRINDDADAGAAIDTVIEELLCAAEDASADAGPTADAHRYGQGPGLCSCWAALVDDCPACLLQGAAGLFCCAAAATCRSRTGSHNLRCCSTHPFPAGV